MWTLTYRKTGRTRSFATLAEAKEATTRAAAKHGTRWLSLKRTEANMIRRIHHIDSSHSWLQVPLSDLSELGIDHHDIAYAHVSGDQLYLGEDEEMGVYLDVAETTGWRLERVERRYPDRCTFIRNLPFFAADDEEAVFFRIFDR